MSEYERFEPHYQPNVALAPIPAPSLSLVSPVLFPHHRHYYHDRRRYCHNSSPNHLKERYSAANIKSEKKPSSPAPGREDEDASAAVTSSTVNADTTPATSVEASSKLEATAPSPHSDSDNDGAASWGGYPIVDYDLPPHQLMQLVQHLVHENAYLRRELAKLSSRQNADRAPNDAANMSAADSTEDNHKDEEDAVPPVAPLDKKERDPGSTVVVKDP